MPRIIVRIELTPAAKTGFAKVAERDGRTQIATTSRVVEWFSNQPETIQAAILGQYPKDIEADVARLLLDRTESAKPVAAR
jgi:hypothetical protein